MTGTIRVAAVIDGLGWGGAEMLLADFATGAEGNGIELSVAYLKEKDGSPAAERLRAVGVEPVDLGIDKLLQRDAVPRVRRHLRSVQPHVVHSHLGYSDLLAGLAAQSLSLPAVCTLHVMRWEGSRRDTTKEALFALARRRCMQRVVTVSDAARAAYLASGRDTAARVVTVRNGVAGRTRPGAGAAVREELGLAPDDVVAVMVTVLRPGKGHDVALRAVDRLRREQPRLRLVVLGDGPSRADIAALAAPLGDGAVLTGHRDDVLAVLDAADVLVHPTEFDAFPTALLEAMAAGVPVVATAVGGIPEIVDDGETGVLIPAPPTADALVDALGPVVTDAARRKDLGEAGRARFHAEFTAEAWGARLRRLYEELLRG